MDDSTSSRTAALDLTEVAEQILALWTASGGFGPPHEFNVARWARGAAKINEQHGLTLTEWRDAHQLAVQMGAKRGAAWP